MAQVPCTYFQDGGLIDYTPEAAVTAGDAIVLGGRIFIAKRDIAAGELGSVAASGGFIVPKLTGAISGWAKLYYDADGDPVGGTAGSGGFTTDSSLGYFAGWATQDGAESGDATVRMFLSASDSLTSVARSSLGQDDLAPYQIPNEAWQLWDSATRGLLGATATSADDLIFTLGTIGTAASKITGSDFGGTSATQKARYQFTVPVEYVAGQTITLRAAAFTGTTVADTSSTIDFSVYRLAAPTVDICATAAQSINALTVANKDFTITPTNVVPGDVLDILMTYAGVDAGDLGAIVPTINQVTLLLDVKG
jgi:predicted RecA/RadA family phage recombinase